MKKKVFSVASFPTAFNVIFIVEVSQLAHFPVRKGVGKVVNVVSL